MIFPKNPKPPTPAAGSPYVGAAVDGLLFSKPVPEVRDGAEWDAIVTRLTTTLAATLEVPLEVQSRRVVDDVALSLRLWSVGAVAGPLALGLTVVVGLEVIEQRPFVNALVFLFAGGERLGTASRSRSYAELVFGPDGVWTLRGWAQDEHEEFVNVPAPASTSVAEASAKAFLSALAGLSARAPGSGAVAARAEALDLLQKWQAASTTEGSAPDRTDLVRGLSATERADLIGALRDLTAWAERPGAEAGERVDATVAWLDRWLGPFLTLGGQAERHETDARITRSVQGSIADRLRESGAAGPRPE